MASKLDSGISALGVPLFLGKVPRLADRADPKSEPTTRSEGPGNGRPYGLHLAAEGGLLGARPRSIAT